MKGEEKIGGRTLKREIFALLRHPNFKESIKEIQRFPKKQSVNPLISFFCSNEEIIRWRAIAAIGLVVASLADEHIESARVVMRRLMWSLNDESGGIGWGAPEAMGEIMAQHETLAKEYHSILVSYVREDCNFLEHPILQRGLLWGLGRLAQLRPELVKDAACFLAPFLKSSDPYHRGLAARVAKHIMTDELKSLIKPLQADTAKIRIFEDWEMKEYALNEICVCF